MLKHKIFIFAAALYALLYIIMWGAAFWLSPQVSGLIKQYVPAEYNLSHGDYTVRANFRLGLSFRFKEVKASYSGVNIVLANLYARVTPLSILRKCVFISTNGTANDKPLKISGYISSGSVDLKGDLSPGTFNIDANFTNNISVSGQFKNIDFVQALAFLPEGPKSDRVIPEFVFTQEMLSKDLEIDVDFKNSSFFVPINGNLTASTSKDLYSFNFDGKIANGKTEYHEQITRSLPVQYNGYFHIKDGKLKTQTATHDLNAFWQSSSSGSTLREILGTSTGKTWITIGEGELDSTIFKMLQFNILTDIVKTINPFQKGASKVTLSCAGIELDMVDGKATLADGSGIKTDALDMGASGKINLKNEKLSVQFATVNYNPLDLNISPVGNLIELNGTMANPRVGISPLGAVKTGVRTLGFVSGGVTSLVGSLVGAQAEEKKGDLCERLNQLHGNVPVRQQ